MISFDFLLVRFSQTTKNNSLWFTGSPPLNWRSYVMLCHVVEENYDTTVPVTENIGLESKTENIGLTEEKLFPCRMEKIRKRETRTPHMVPFIYAIFREERAEVTKTSNTATREEMELRTA
jgi:hypothetical protein